MKPGTEYENKQPYPSKDNFATTYWYKAGKLIATRKLGENFATLEDGSITDLEAVMLLSAVKEKVYDREAHVAALSAYGAETSRLYDMFKADLFEDLGIADNPKREKLFSIAWEDGHSSGYNTVYNIASDLVELIV